MSRNLTPAEAKAMSAARKSNAGGRPKIIRPCPRCGVTMSARELWRHRCG